MKKEFFKTFIFSAALFTLPFSAYAAPNITSAVPVTTFSHSTVVNVSGSGFGSKTQAAPLLWNPIDGESTYSGYANGQALPSAIGPWPGTAGTAYYKTSNPRGKWVAKYSNTPRSSVSYDGQIPPFNADAYAGNNNGNNGAAAVGNIGWAPCTKVYVSWWTWMSFNSFIKDFIPACAETGSTAACPGSGSDKFFRLTENGPWVNATFIWAPNLSSLYSSDYNLNKYNDWTDSWGAWKRNEALIDNRSYVGTYGWEISESSDATPPSAPGGLAVS